MKVKLTRSELRECVENAVLRIVNEGKSLHKFKDNEDFGGKGKKTHKHGKLDKRGSKQPKGGNKGNFDWTETDED